MSTLVPELSDYTNLVTSEHRDKPLFLATVSLPGQFGVDERTQVLSMLELFDLDTAEGDQLDKLGDWLAQTRYITPRSSELWPTPNNPTPVTLADSDYRRLLKAKALACLWDGTPEMAADILAVYYSSLTGMLVGIIDNQDMSIDLIMAGTNYHAIYDAAVIRTDLLGLKPSGVRIRRALSSAGEGPVFGLDVANSWINGPDFGALPKEF